jgi:hypothetical protein
VELLKLPVKLFLTGAGATIPSDPFTEGVAPMKKYLVTLTEEERQHLAQLLAKGKTAKHNRPDRSDLLGRLYLLGHGGTGCGPQPPFVTPFLHLKLLS